MELLQKLVSSALPGGMSIRNSSSLICLPNLGGLPDVLVLSCFGTNSGGHTTCVMRVRPRRQIAPPLSLSALQHHLSGGPHAPAEDDV